jgi:DNA-binding transcriptional regulator of glucitol operon
VTMVLLGRWQLHVSESKHFSLQNFGYTIQWWLFAAFTLFLWWRVVRDAAVRRAAAAGGEPTPEPPPPAQQETVTYRRYVPPRAPAEAGDAVHAAYNDYLASLAAKDAEKKQ